MDLFAFAVCQIGAEPALKGEIARLHPGWRFAYSRPGLVTFRSDAPLAPEFALGAVFARAYGISIGKADDDQQVLLAARRVMGREAASTALMNGEPARAALMNREVPGTPVINDGRPGGPLVLHVFERDRARPGNHNDSDTKDNKDQGDYGPLAAQLDARLRAAALEPGAPQALFAPPHAPLPGEVVLDVIVTPDEPPWLGYHVHGGAHSPHPGGRVPLRLPPQAPSRAWLKIEEALSWSGLPLRAGEVAVEIGSAPGGASWALLQRGLTVIGVDPGAMDPLVLAQPGFQHRRVTLGDLRREDLPRQVDWLLLDVNLAPQVALHGARRIVSTLRSTLRGVVFTLKLNDWRMAAQVPALCQRVAGMGLTDVRATQLASNRREICVVATLPGPGRSR